MLKIEKIQELDLMREKEKLQELCKQLIKYPAMPSEQNLILNILTFSHKVEKVDLAISTEKSDDSFAISKREWPVNINELFPELDSKIVHLYVKLNPGADDKKLTVNLNINKRFAKIYYSQLVYDYLKTKANITYTNFVDDIELWFRDEKSDTKDFWVLKKFTVKVQMQRITKSGELAISYDGTSKVLKKNLKDLNAPTEIINKVILNKMLMLDSQDDEVQRNLSNSYPVFYLKFHSFLNLPDKYDYNQNKL